MNQPISSSPISRSVIAMMTDFGLGDGDVGVMKGVIAGITPNAHLIDITHDVAPQNVASGAWILASAYRYFPQGTVFVCVVDPGVGSSRGAIAIYAGNWFFVGPDNGLFSYIFMQQPVHQAVVLDNPAYHLSQVSSTFHGRDIFAPVGAHLAGGVALDELGTQIDPVTLQRIDIGYPVLHGARLDAHILHVDHFGNLITSIPLGMVPELFSGSHVHIVFSGTSTVVDRRRRFFAEGPDDSRPFIYGDSSGYVGIAVRNGHAARTLNAGIATPITLVMGEG
jgi:S-adenosyl-L-methionine hydrolase (adenosine-forming)